MMNSSQILSIITFVYGLAAFLYIFAWVFKKPAVGGPAMWVTTAGAIGNLFGILLRWFESYQLGFGHAPLSNLYESMAFFAFTTAVLYLVVEKRYQNRTIGAFITPLVFTAMAYASLSPNISDRIQPLIPALKSNWLIAHVIACFLGYAAFAVAFGVSLMYLLKRKPALSEKSLLHYLPEPGVLDELTHQLIMFGFLFLSAGIITGAVWANSAWGRYWGWDPKEVWALVALLGYVAVLHARYVGWVRNLGLAAWSVICFSLVLMAWYGVNYILGMGLHSYGFGGGGTAYVFSAVGLQILYVGAAVATAYAWEGRRALEQAARRDR